MTEVLAAGADLDTGADETETAAVAGTPAVDEKTAGADATADTAAVSTLPENWRALIAGEDKSLLKTLERIKDPADVGKKIAELNKLAGQKGAAPKKPGEGATAEEVAAYREAVGLPPKADAYLEKLALPDGRVLGDEDKAIAANFAESVFGADYSQAQFDKAIDWYLSHVETSHAEMIENDEAFKDESRKALKEEMGPHYQRNLRAVGLLFQEAPDGLWDAVQKARTPDGRLLGNDAGFIRWASKLGLELHPAASVMPAGATDGKALDSEIAVLRKLAGDKTSDYWVGPTATAKQARYLELLSAKERLTAKR